ncbi:MAG: PEP-CTERM sorting domain-containing protein [Verrucomicrobiota bacterium JB022]|nr:PEP-CTERM sorting domain-containing protein [Verrucomicrobiota bacterium JB022]
MRTLITLSTVFTVSLTAHAAVNITALEVSGDVVFTAAGTLDLSSLTFAGSGLAFNQINASASYLSMGSGFADSYISVTGPSSFGTSEFTSSTTFSGDGIVFTSTNLLVPAGYVSGTALSSTMTFEDATLESLGLTPGSYTWSWGSDSATLTISAPAVPEPTTYALLGGLAALGFAAWRRRRG